MSNRSMERAVLVVVAISCLATATGVRAHQGGLDSYGCHYDLDAGGYHCHQGQFAGQSFPSREEMLNQLSCSSGTIAANRQTVTPPAQGTDSEPACTKAKLEPPSDYFLAPRDMLDWTPNYPLYLYTHLFDYLKTGFHPALPPTMSVYNSPPTSTIRGAPGSTLGANEGRVRSELRTAAQQKNPMHDLCLAAQRFERDQAASGNTPSDRDFGNAFADLSVTGKAAFALFKQLHPNLTSLGSQAECAGATAPSLTMALTRAYRVANALRGLHDSPERKALGWIAVSGEDDQPYRPVNVPSSKFPQFELKVDVPIFNIAINTRYMIAHARNTPAFARPATPLVDGGPGLRVPAEPLPGLARDAQVILFLHGGDSRLEEAGDLTAALHRLGGRNWTVISMDLPTSGYADNIDHDRVSPIEAVQCHHTPLVDFVEEFIAAFVDALDGRLRGQLKPRIKTVVGGSLGGNMAMRLGRRPNTPWVTSVVPWSPASIWPSFVGQPNAVAAGCDTCWDGTHDMAVNMSLKWAGLGPGSLPAALVPGYLPPGLAPSYRPADEVPERRRELFYGGFDWAPAYGISGQPPQAECWFSDKFQCKKTNNLGARIDRQETYDANFRAWHWRLGAEQLVFSHQQHAPGTNAPLYLRNTKRMLLFCGAEDTCGNLCAHTQDVASKMVNTPGCARFLGQTGHSQDNEHPFWIARQIADFLANDHGFETADALDGLAPLLFNDDE